MWWKVGILILLMAALAPGTAGATVRVNYEYYCYGTGSDGLPTQDEGWLMDQTQVAGSAIDEGSPVEGNFGEVLFRADLATGRLRAYGFAHGVMSENWPGTFSATGRVESLGFSDRLTFTIPAGDYPDGVVVRLHGAMRGHLFSDVGAGARVTASVYFYTSVYSLPVTEVGAYEEGSITIDEPFTLEHYLVNPGAHYENPVEVVRDLTASLTGLRTWAPSVNPGGGYVIGDGLGQFYSDDNGLSLTHLETEPAVAWVSESGVFLSQVSGVVAMPSGSQKLLGACYPNPFNPCTMIPFRLPEESRTDLRIYGLDGRLVQVLYDGALLSAGPHEVAWDGCAATGHRVAAGTYIFRLRTRWGMEAGRMVLVK